MARAALHSHHELAIAMPIAIAIVAMGRYMVVSSDHNALHQMMYAGAIFILVAALFLWKMRVRLPVGRQARTTLTKKQHIKHAHKLQSLCAFFMGKNETIRV